MINHRKTTQSGFTLIEMIIVITLIAIIAGLGSLLLGEATRAYFLGKATQLSTQTGSTVLQRMARELHGAYQSGVNVISATQIQFTEANGDLIDYRLQGTTLERRQNTNPWRYFLSPVAGVTFASFTSNGANYVSIALTISRANGTVNLRTSVFPRN